MTSDAATGIPGADGDTAAAATGAPAATGNAGSAGNAEARRLPFASAVAMFRSRVQRSGDRSVFRTKVDGAWRSSSWNDWDRAARETAGGLLALGLAAGDRVAILAGTRPEWMHADVGILMAGGVTVPIYQSSLASECEYILADSGARFVLAENPHQLEKLLAVRARLPAVEKVIYFDERERMDKPDKQGRIALDVAAVVPEAQRGWVCSLSSLRADGARWLGEHAGELERRSDALGPDDLLTVVYTSGTTGNPKGVMLTHEAIVFTCDAVREVLPVTEDDEQLLYLPLAHIFARILEWVTVQKGSRIAFAESIAAIVGNLAETRPTFFASVPRVFEKIYIKVLQNRDASPPTKKRVFDWALSVGRKVSRRQQDGRAIPPLLELQRLLAHKLVFGKLHALVGGRMRYMVAGGAPLSREIAEFFHAVGLIIIEGYGLTETTAASFINRLDRFRFGTVGLGVPGVQLRLAGDGEILLRGPSVMKGYYHLPEATAEAFAPVPAADAATGNGAGDELGWFHTGDIGALEDGFLRITDRKKDLIKTSGGKYVAPQSLENALKATPFVSQALIYGDNRPFVSALITVDEESVRAFVRQNGLGAADAPMAELVKLAPVKKLVDDAVSRVNHEQPSFATIKKWEILPADFSQEGGELTPSLKVRRKFATEKYRAILDRLYIA